MWKEYARDVHIHDALLSYLELHPNNFYRVETDVDGMNFVTARGWEDLSSLIKVYEAGELAVTEDVIGEFIHHPDIAEDVYAYLEIYRKYNEDYGISDILSGNVKKSVYKRVFDADFDERITNYLVTEFYRQQNVDLRKDNTAMQRVREEAEKAKKVLSSSSSTTINLPFITTVKGQPVHMEMNLTRAEFNEITKDLVERTAIPVNQALSDAGISAAELGMVLLVGGSTRVPAVVEEVRRITGKEPSHNLNPDECVALGAAVQGGKLGGAIVAGSSAAEIILMDVTPLSLGIETVGGVSTKIIDRNTTIPTRYSQIFTTAGSFQTSVDIKVLQGERQFARDNKLIGNFRLKGIKPAPAGCAAFFQSDRKQKPDK